MKERRHRFTGAGTIVFNKAMFRNYFKTTLRHLLRNKVTFFFKTSGLTLSLLSLLIIAIYVSHQSSFDTFHESHENVYRVNSIREENDKAVNYSTVPPGIGPALGSGFPEVTAFARLGMSSRVMVEYQEKLFRLTGFVEADSTIFDVLSFTFLKGDKRALSQPASIVLTQSTARQIFGGEDPINKVITSTDHSDRMLTVRAIVQDFPSNSHLTINAIHSVGSLIDSNWNSWEINWDGSVHLFVRMAPGSSPEEFVAMAEPVIRKNLVKNYEQREKKFGIYLQPIARVYLDAPLKMEFHKKGNAQYIFVFSILGIFLLAIACINYVNLSIADFDTRTREIGVRKVLGARKRQVGFQVAIEAFGIIIVSLVFGVGLLYLLFPIVAHMLDPNLTFNMILNSNVIFICALTVIVIMILSTAYPSYILAIQNPVQDLKANTTYASSMNVGKTLLIVQCVISIICICATVIIGKQIGFVRDTDLGYNRAHVVSLVMPDEYPNEKVSVLKDQMSKLPGVDAVSYSYYLMPISTYFKGWYQIEKNGTMERMLVNEMFVDHSYFQTMGISLIDGRNFSVEHASDVRESFIVNETAANAFGWSDPIGKRIKVGYPGETEDIWEGSVIGVVKDFHTLSLHHKIEPVILRLQHDSWPGNSLNVRVNRSLAESLPAIVATYEKVMSGFLADVRVVEDLHARQYQNEARVFSSLQVATVVVMFVSAFGIFSLSVYMSVKRMKEFGIRKVLGASVRQIAFLHISYFLKIVVLANLVALPVAYLLMDHWLSGFAYRTNLDSMIFFLALLISCILIIISAGYSAVKAGSMNPVDVIKN